MRKILRHTLILSVFIVMSGLYSGNSYAQYGYFYTGKEYGSESLYNPLYFTLNSGFDIIQYEQYDRRLGKLTYGKGFSNVAKNMFDPFGPIKRYGTWDFIKREILPLTFKQDEAQWVPNYLLHLIGGGMTYAALADWYTVKKFPYPKTAAFVNKMFIDFLCESVENGSYEGDDVGIISDMWFFNLGGAFLFMSKDVQKFFGKKLNLTDWSYQPSIGLSDFSIQNNGQYFMIKWPVPFVDKISVTYFFGMCGMGGLSYKFDDGKALSLSIGFRSKERVLTNPHTNMYKINLYWDFALFYDRNNSLMASVFYSVFTENKLNINIYPGLFLPNSKFSPGLWAVMKRDNRWIFGISTKFGFGIGLF